MFSSKQHAYSISAILLCLLFPAIASAGWLQAYEGPAWTPQLRLPDLQQRPVDLKALRGQVVLVNFWASWCSPCLVELPSMRRLQQRLADRPFRLLAVNAGETRQRVETTLRSMRLQLPVLLDGEREVYKAWGLKLLPASFLVDIHGAIRYVAKGALDWDDDEVVATIETLLKEAKGQAGRPSP